MNCSSSLFLSSLSLFPFFFVFMYVLVDILFRYICTNNWRTEMFYQPFVSQATAIIPSFSAICINTETVGIAMPVAYTHQLYVAVNSAAGESPVWPSVWRRSTVTSGISRGRGTVHHAVRKYLHRERRPRRRWWYLPAWRQRAGQADAIKSSTLRNWLPRLA